ncbi:MAG: hypothetical protein ABL984_00550 [Pyrinomonadaceae bacterium]
MNARRAKASRNRAHLSEGRNSNWSPLRLATVTNHALYDPALDGDCFKNDLYTVFRREISPGAVHLSIRRNDREAAKDWRDFQRIKNELAGPEWEGLELYPAESRLVDAANQYHLWCVSQRIEIGFDERCVTDEATISGSKQRELPPDWKKTPIEEVAGLAGAVKGLRDEAKEDGLDVRSGA